MQHIDTAPVWAAYKEGGECPLCSLERSSEEQYVDNFLGGSVMEPAVRIEVNGKGFCAAHFRMLYDAGNRLGVALMAHTHLKALIEKIENYEAPKARRFARADDGAGELLALTERCILCDRLTNAMERYEDTLIWMWAHESAFRDALSGSKGLCIPHFARLMALAPKRLSARDAKAFCEELTRVTVDNLRRVERDLEWFTLKFDYRNQDKPWGDSEDAVERALNKLRSNAIRVKKESDT